MPADNCQPQPLPFESVCEAGEVAPARAPRARAVAAVLTAAAAALVLLAVAGRVGPSTGAATLAAPEAIVAKAEIPCAGFGESCAVSKCCSNPGDKCYRKHAYWSSCNQSCDPYSMYVIADNAWKKTSEKVWDCEEDTDTTDTSTAITADPIDTSEQSPCSEGGDNCTVTQCCADNSMKCYVKDEHWAMCNQTCNPTANLTEDGSVSEGGSWTCDELTIAGTAITAITAPEAIAAKAEIPCTGSGESCAVSKCCSNPGDKCYRKHAYWSSCNQTCNPTAMWTQDGWVSEGGSWTCDDLTV